MKPGESPVFWDLHATYSKKNNSEQKYFSWWSTEDESRSLTALGKKLLSSLVLLSFARQQQCEQCEQTVTRVCIVF